MKASIGPKVDSRLERSPQGDDVTFVPRRRQNLTDSKWYRLEMVSNDHPHKDAQEFIFQEMAQTTQTSIQDLETTDCLSNLQPPSTPPWNLSGIEKADPNLLESRSKVSTCQARRESQTRSSDYLKKSSMNPHAQQISATTSQRAQQTTQQISATSGLDLPQSRSEDEDEHGPQKERMNGFEPQMNQCSLNVRRPF